MIRQVMRGQADRLSGHASARLDTTRAACDPDGEVTVARWVARLPCIVSAKIDLATSGALAAMAGRTPRPQWSLW